MLSVVYCTESIRCCVDSLIVVIHILRMHRDVRNTDILQFVSYFGFSSLSPWLINIFVDRILSEARKHSYLILMFSLIAGTVCSVLR